jgi:hypothetical protein
MELSRVFLGRRLCYMPFLLAAGRRAYAASQGVKALSGLLVAGTTAIDFSTDPRRSDDQT